MKPEEAEMVGRYVEVEPWAQLAGMRPNDTYKVLEAHRRRSRVFFSLSADSDDRKWKWFDDEQVRPARAELKPGRAPRVVSNDVEERVHMSADTKLFNLATTIATTKGCSWAEATRQAGLQLGAVEVLTYRGITDEKTPAEPTTAAPVAQSGSAQVGRMILEKRKLGLSDKDANEAVFSELLGQRASDSVHLRRLPGERFSQMVNRVEREQNLSTRDAMRLCSEQFPQLAESWANGTDLVAAR